MKTVLFTTLARCKQSSTFCLHLKEDVNEHYFLGKINKL